MIRLSLPTEDYNLTLPAGVTVTVRPCTMTVYQAALSAARNALIAAIKTGTIVDGTKIGAAGNYEGGDPNFRSAFIKGRFAIELARLGIVAWQGVKNADGEGDAPVTSENVAIFAAIPAIGTDFFEKYTAQAMVVAAEGNA